MKQADVKVGGVYAAKVSGKVVPVHIDAENAHGGWTGTNQATGKQVRIKSAQRLRYAMAKKDGRWRRVAGGGGKDATRANVGDEGAAQGDAKAAKKGCKGKAKRGGKASGEKKMGCLDAAARVLEEAGEPMRCGDIITVAFEKGYWHSGGRTPASTLHAAVCREIAKKGKDSRFAKVDRGLFALNR
jgi:hypothetical protein